MRINLISYATPQFIKSQNELVKSALENGVDFVFSYTRVDLVATSFYRANKAILDQKKGGGYWLWKPFFILETLKSLNDNDVLLYADAGSSVVQSISFLAELCFNNEIVLFANGGGYVNSEYTKRDCFILLNCDTAAYYHSAHLTASFQLYKKNSRTIDFVAEWLKYCQIPQALLDNQSTLGNELPNFIAHRHDQSILSLLAKKHVIPLFRDPSQFGESLRGYSNSTYGILFDHHRRRSLSLGEKMRKFIK